MPDDTIRFRHLLPGPRTAETDAETVLVLPPATIATATSKVTTLPYTTVSDTITVTGTAGQPGQLTAGQHGMTSEVRSRECRLRVVVGHQI